LLSCYYTMINTFMYGTGCAFGSSDNYARPVQIHVFVVFTLYLNTPIGNI